MHNYLLTIFMLPVLGLAADVAIMDLPPPQTEGGKPLMQVLKTRQSAREFSSRSLSPQVLSNLLWAAAGINRPDGRRTAPTAPNRQEIDIYVILADGLHLYEPKGHKLIGSVSEDLRALAGTQDFVKTAPVNLVYVSDFGKYGPQTKEEEKVTYSWADTGFVSQNVYLFCASEGLATVVRGN